MKGYFSILLALITIIAFLLLIVDYYMGREWITKNFTIILTHIVYLLIFLPIILTLLNNKNKEVFVNPKVVRKIDDKILVIKTVNWLSDGTVVTIYYLENDFERLVATGFVSNIQQNGLIQISYNIENDEQSSLDALENIIIKPGKNFRYEG